MERQNLFADTPWEVGSTDPDLRYRVFWRPGNARLGATLYEFAPGSRGMKLHMHYGADEMFFVVSGRVGFWNGEVEEELQAGDFLYCPDGRAGLHGFRNRTDEPVRILAISAGDFPDVVAYPEDGYAWVATRDPDVEPDDDPGIIVRFDYPE